MADIPVVDWSVLKPQATGSRTYHGPEVATRATWRCPACGEEATTPLAEGCPACGSGKPGQHVGVDPIVTPEERLRLLAAQERPGKIISVQRSVQRFEEADFAFSTWVALRPVRPPDALLPLLQEAFRAAWTIRSNQARTPIEVPDVAHEHPADPAPLAPDDPDLAVPPAVPTAAGTATPIIGGTAEQRTILAALIYFRDQVLPEAAEEIGSGQWLGIADVDTLIAELQKELA